MSYKSTVHLQIYYHIKSQFLHEIATKLLRNFQVLPLSWSLSPDCQEISGEMRMMYKRLTPCNQSASHQKHVGNARILCFE